MSKPAIVAKPCTIRVTRSYHDRVVDVCVVGTGTKQAPTVYRSVRNAREQILDAMQHMDRLSSVTYEIDLVTLNGQVIPVRESVVDYVEDTNRWESQHNSIGARMARGEAVAW